MRSILKAIIITLCLLVKTYLSYSENTGTNINHILVLNAYSSSNPWSNSFITPIVNMASQNKQIGVYVENLNMLTLQDAEARKNLKKDILSEVYSYSPKVIVLIGNASFILHDELNRRWPDIPMILCGERDYTGPIDSIIQGHPLTEEERIPINSLQDKYNLTMMQANIYMEENLQLMKQLIPQMDKVIYIGDETYICQQNDYDLSKLIREKYPEMGYEFISAKNTSTDSLFSILNQQDLQTTGILFSSWLRAKDYNGNTVLISNSHRIIATSSMPLFSFRTVGVDEEGGIVGGYIYDEEKYVDRLLNTIKEILNGKQARDIPFYYATDAAPRFNYQSLIQHNLSPERCPENTVFYNAPPTFWEQYEYIIIGSICFIIVLLLSFQYHRLHVLEKMKRLQQKELETTTRYYSLINNMPILYMSEELIKNKEGRIINTKYTDVNKHFENRFFKRNEIIGKSGSEMFPESMPQFLYFMNIALREKRSITFSYYYKEIDTFYDIVVNATSDGRFMDVFCLNSTELHHAQKQLRSINHKLSMALDIANIVPWKWNLQTHTILCDINKPVELSDNNKINEEQMAVPDNQYFAKIYKEDLPKVKEAYADLIAGRIQTVKEEYRVVNRVNGCKHIDWVEARAAVESYDEKGKPLTLVGSSLVITERKKMETDLVSAKNRAEESNRLKSAFLANMSHEIRTPLNAIVGFSGILASTEAEEEKQEYVSIIDNNNTLLLQLISDILDLSKIEAGTMEFIDTDFELNKVMTELESSLRLKLSPDKEVTLSFEPQLPELYIHAERNRISQIIINLATNAIKFTNKGSIRFGYEKRDNGTLYFYVTDTGCGIPAEKQKDIFERFVKLNNFAQGTGLGLSICQTLVEHMGGEIGLKSQINEGSTFWFTLPYVPATNQHHEEETKSEPIKIKKQKITILVAEDHESNYHLIESILKKDYTLVHAWNGKEAVDLFKEYAPQLILMDINMPVMDGYEATKEIRKYSTQVPIIAVTAFAYASDEQKVMENGFDAYMAKPINADQLKTQITSMLRQHIIFM